MKNWDIVFGVTMALFILAAVSCGPAATPTPTATPDTRGKTLVASKCSTCHGLAQVQAARYDQGGWEALVKRMVGNGAQLTLEQQQLVAEYLVNTYPKE